MRTVLAKRIFTPAPALDAGSFLISLNVFRVVRLWVEYIMKIFYFVGEILHECYETAFSEISF
jgi:hypothetical protein